MNPRADVVVLGGGLVGLSSAYELAKRGLAVTVIERNVAGGDQSRRALGFLSLIVKGEYKIRLSARAVELWATLEDELEADLEFKRGGELTVATSAAAIQRLREWAKVAAAAGVEVEGVAATDLERFVPGFRYPNHGAIFVPTGGHAEPQKAPLAYVDAARRRGVTIEDGCAATAIEVSSGRINGVQTTRGRIATSNVVCAAGVATTRILRTLGLRLPTVVVRGLALETTPIPPTTEVATLVGGLAFRQRPDGRLYVSYITRGIHDLTLDSFRYMREFLASRDRSSLMRIRLNETLPRDLWRTLSRARSGSDDIDTRSLFNRRSPASVLRASRQLMGEVSPAFVDLGVDRQWGEAIDVTPDDLPVLDRVPGIEGMIVAAGFSGHGFTLGPLAGQLVAGLVTEDGVGEDLRPLRFGRFAEHDFVPSGERL